MTEDEYTFEPVTKDAGDDLPVELLFGHLEECIEFWQPDELVEENEYCKPRVPNGFAAKCTTAGRTGGREPHWKKVAAQTVTDGSAVWTMEAAGQNGINAVAGATAVSDPLGLTISGVAAEESTKIVAEYSGGTDGEDYDAVFTFTIGGKARVARQKVQIRKR
jgi:hypothetical protein